jgi:hypothetical protein
MKKEKIIKKDIRIQNEYAGQWPKSPTIQPNIINTKTKTKKPKLNDAKIPPTGKFEISNIPFNFRHG